MQPACNNLCARLPAIAFDWIDWYDDIAVFWIDWPMRKRTIAQSNPEKKAIARMADSYKT